MAQTNTRQIARTDQARRDPPAPIPIAPGLAPDAEQVGRIALAVLGEGNLDKMSDEGKTRFIIEAARMLGLNPVMSPFLVVKFENKSVLYLTKGGAEMLAKLHGVSTEVTSKGVEFGLFTVTVRARQGERFADATGAVPFETTDGQMIALAQRARVIKIAESQARRRAILALIGLGFLDRPGMPDPDAMLDRHGNLATRRGRRELPESSATVGEIFADEPPDTYRGGAGARAEAEAAERVMTPSDEEIAAAAAEDAGAPAIVVAGGRVEVDGSRIVGRGRLRGLAVQAHGLSAPAAAAVGSVLARWADVREDPIPSPPASDAGEADWSAWVDQVGAALDGEGAGG